MRNRAEETRQMFLDAGLALLRGKGLEARLPNLSVPLLLQQVDKPLSRGAFHNIWPRREEYELELTRYLIESWGRNGQDPINRALEDIDFGDGTDLNVAIEALADGITTIIDPEPDLEWLSGVACGFSAYGTAFVNDLYTSLEAPFVPIIEALLERSGMQMRNDMRAEDALMVISGLIESFTIRAMAIPVERMSERLAFQKAFRQVVVAGLHGLIEPKDSPPDS